MASMIYNPLEEYESKFQNLHFDNVNKYFDRLVQESGVNIAQNRETVNQYNIYKENLSKLKKKLNWLKFFRVLMCISLILIPVVIWKTTPKIKALRSEIEQADKKAEELLGAAYNQMAPLCSLFNERDSLTLIEQTIPAIRFDTHFSAKQEVNMITNFDFHGSGDTEQSTLDVLYGEYNDNPFLFENKLIHTMGTETYHGYKTISWVETFRDSNGRLQTRTRSQTLHATVEKPKPFYTTRVILNYGAQGGPELSFSRDATYLDRKSDKAIERYVKKGEKKLKRKTDAAISGNRDFMSMSNTDFEVLFDALDRNNEVQFRTLFTPLAQTNMVDLIRSQSGYGDDFNFVKINRMNTIMTSHSQGREINVLPASHASYSFDVIKESFINKNAAFFKAVYFDFAPLWAIPIYQERPVHSLDPIPDFSRLYSQNECEALANAMDRSYAVHPDTKTNAILKARYVESYGDTDHTLITAYSYDIFRQVDFVPVFGGDGRFHNVPVEWDEYIPLTAENHFYITKPEAAQNQRVIAAKDGLCIYN